MRKQITVLIFVAVFLAALVAGAAGAHSDTPSVARPAERSHGGSAEPSRATRTGSETAFHSGWSSLNSGGTIGAASENFRAGLSIGQVAVGRGASANFQTGIGFWYGIGTGSGCSMVRTGDVDVSGAISAADVIYLVIFALKSGPAPLPCEAAGDVNCSGNVNATDVIYLAMHVFKGGDEPCDACASALAAGC